MIMVFFSCSVEHNLSMFFWTPMENPIDLPFDCKPFGKIFRFSEVLCRCSKEAVQAGSVTWTRRHWWLESWRWMLNVICKWCLLNVVFLFVFVVVDVAAQVHTRPSFKVLTGNLVAGESCLGKEQNDQRKAQSIEIYLSRGITICRSPESRGRQTCFLVLEACIEIGDRLLHYAHLCIIQAQTTRNSPNGNKNTAPCLFFRWRRMGRWVWCINGSAKGFLKTKLGRAGHILPVGLFRPCCDVPNVGIFWNLLEQFEVLKIEDLDIQEFSPSTLRGGFVVSQETI